MRSLITLLVASFLVGGCACDCHAQGRTTFNPNKKIDGHTINGKSLYNSGRLGEMPTGPNKLDCYIVVSDQWQSNKLEYALYQAIASDPRMQQVKAGTYWNYLLVSSPKFRDSGLKQALGTATPIVVVQAHDGAIRGDGTGGLYVNAQSCPQTADEIVDMICDAIEHFNPPPVVEGQTNATQIIRESSAPCPGPDCNPNQTPAPQPVIQPTLTPVRPRPAFEKYLQYGGYALIGCSIFVAALTGLGIFAMIAGSLYQRWRTS